MSGSKNESHFRHGFAPQNSWDSSSSLVLRNIYICLQGACSVASPFFTLALIYSQAGLKNKSSFWHGFSPQIIYNCLSEARIFASQFFRLTCVIRLVWRINLRHGPSPQISLRLLVIVLRYINFIWGIHFCRAIHHASIDPLKNKFWHGLRLKYSWDHLYLVLEIILYRWHWFKPHIFLIPYTPYINICLGPENRFLISWAWSFVSLVLKRTLDSGINMSPRWLLIFGT